jgi:ribosomal protein S18
LGRKISQTDITGRQVNYRFDKSNQLVDICNEFDQSIVSFARDADGAIQKITHANGMWQDIAYDADKNIVSLTVATPDKILAQNTSATTATAKESRKMSGQVKRSTPMTV